MYHLQRGRERERESAGRERRHSCRAKCSPYQLVGGSEEVVGGVAHEVDTGGAVEVGKPTGHDGKVGQPRSCACHTALQMVSFSGSLSPHLRRLPSWLG